MYAVFEMGVREASNREGIRFDSNERFQFDLRKDTSYMQSAVRGAKVHLLETPWLMLGRSHSEEGIIALHHSN